MTDAKTRYQALGVLVVALLGGCCKCNDQAEARSRSEDAAASQVLRQGDGRVREWGSSGFTGFGTSAEPRGASAASATQGVSR